MFYVYVLKSTSADKFYIGQTKNLDKRFIHHNSTYARWTKRFQPWELVYKENCITRAEAMKRERYLKNLSRLKLSKLISA